MTDLTVCAYCGRADGSGFHRGDYRLGDPNPPHMFLPRWLVLGLPRPVVTTGRGWRNFNLAWSIRLGFAS